MWAWIKFLLIIIAAIYFLPRLCSDYDSDSFPYSMIGLNVWVYDPATDHNFPAGALRASYSQRKEALSDCYSVARQYATAHHLEQWQYVCCTVTDKNPCVTKVR